MSRVRVLCVMTVKPAYDGPTLAVVRLARALDPEKVQFDISFISQPPEKIRAQLEEIGCRIHLLPGRLRHPLRYMLALKKLVRNGGYEVVHAHGNSCTLAIDLLAAYLGGAPTRIAHSHNSFCKYRAAHRALRPIFDRLYTHALACGEEAGRWLFRERPFRVVRNATETRALAFDARARAEYREKLGLGEDTLALGCVANLNSQKNHGFMIDMFAGLHEARPDMRLILVGDGPLKGDIERSIAERGLTGWVTLLGVRSDVAKLLQAFDVMLLTSLYEGFPNVLVEWQCAGLRSLVSDRVTPDAALTPLVEFLPIDAGAEPWVEALKDAHADPDRALTSGRALAEIREKGFDIAAVAREHEEMYLQAAKIAK